MTPPKRSFIAPGSLTITVADLIVATSLICVGLGFSTTFLKYAGFDFDGNMDDANVAYATFASVNIAIGVLSAMIAWRWFTRRKRLDLRHAWSPGNYLMLLAMLYIPFYFVREFIWLSWASPQFLKPLLDPAAAVLSVVIWSSGMITTAMIPKMRWKLVTFTFALPQLAIASMDIISPTDMMTGSEFWASRCVIVLAAAAAAQTVMAATVDLALREKRDLGHYLGMSLFLALCFNLTVEWGWYWLY
ncbi:hypothetical protein [Blastopirellula retiformator]|uniref:Uncharacterized protein n=1 Tax=Blastopirellula retiformator TaxID=2527970 RepID=A0A5C5VKQ9_9BACT|nr:hypothetical protein [Blastopirellula retiformator]TWT38469.1 hypothetical protein Enr8_01610 [Blastopirellula retiformator]